VTLLKRARFLGCWSRARGEENHYLNYMQFIPEFKADKDLVFQSGTKFTLAFLQAATECNDTRANGNPARVAAIFQLVIMGVFHGSGNVISKNST
jgi:hypothetical protein